MSERPLGAPTTRSPKHGPERCAARAARRFDEITLEGVMAGDVTMEDLASRRRRCSPRPRWPAPPAGRRWRPISSAAAEMVGVPQDVIMQVYELLRPGRAKGKDELMTAAESLRETHGTPRLADFVEEAAKVYSRRGLYVERY